MTQPSGRRPQASEVCGHRCSSSVHIILGTGFRQPSLTRNDLAPTHRTGLITTEQPATEQLATEQPATYRLQSSWPHSDRPQSSRLLTEGCLRTEPTSLRTRRGAAGQARTTAAGQFSCRPTAQLSAAQVFGREDEDEALTDHGPPPPAPPFARPP
eukprot:scaffold20588_cov69-Phaeocystis_antarctica.AAC.5